MKYKKPKWAAGQEIRATGLIEDTCEHGVGHPNQMWLKAYPDKAQTLGIHCCDGCCNIEPQKLSKEVTFSNEIPEIKVLSIEDREDGRCDIHLDLNNSALSLVVQDSLRRMLERAVRESRAPACSSCGEDNREEFTLDKEHGFDVCDECYRKNER